MTPATGQWRGAAAVLLTVLTLACIHENYRSAIAGREYDTTIGGQPVHLDPRERNTLNAVNVGAVLNAPNPSHLPLLPTGALFFHRNSLQTGRLRLSVAVVDNDLRYSRDLVGKLALVTTFQNRSVPIGQSEFLGGIENRSEELLWGWARGGFGVGTWILRPPYEEDSALELSATVEPGVLWFRRTDSTAETFVTPRTAFEPRLHLFAHLDSMVRNLFELRHEGLAFGADLSGGHRSPWARWGAADSTPPNADFALATAYVTGATRAPFLNDRHRLIGSLYAGDSLGSDRFNAFRLGGGPGGEERGALSRAVFPGAFVEELLARRYLLATAEYRLEALFFLYFHLRASVLFADLLDSKLSAWSAGPVVTTGMFFGSQLQIAFSHSSLRRAAGPGANEIVVQWSKGF